MGRRRSYLALLALLGAVVGVSDVEAQEGGRLILTDREIIVVHPSAPERQVVAREGWCGRTQFRLVVRAYYGDWQRRLHSVKVGSRELGRSVRAAVAPWIRPNMILDNAVFDQCSDDGQAARLRLSLIENPGAGSRLVFLDLWIRRGGDIAAIRYN
jgi:hypothetical protein